MSEFFLMSEKKGFEKVLDEADKLLRHRTRKGRAFSVDERENSDSFEDSEIEQIIDKSLLEARKQQTSIKK